MMAILKSSWTKYEHWDHLHTTQPTCVANFHDGDPQVKLDKVHQARTLAKAKAATRIQFREHYSAQGGDQHPPRSGTFVWAQALLVKSH
jgi:hypothetical protein